MKKSYYCLPNDIILSEDLTAKEFAVLAYLVSIYSNIKCKTGTYITVKQSTIAKKCGIADTRTVSAITDKLKEKGYITATVRIAHKFLRKSCYHYLMNDSKIAEMMNYDYYFDEELHPHCDKHGHAGYTLIDRNAFNHKLSPKELRVYAFVAMSISSGTGRCWQSYNDIAKAVHIKRGEAIEIIKNLIQKKRIYRAYNIVNKAYRDNVYSLFPFVRTRKQTKKEFPCRNTGTLRTNTLKQRICQPLRFNYKRYNGKCQVFLRENFPIFQKIQKKWRFFVRGSP